MFNDNAQLLQLRVTMATKKSCNLIGAAVYWRQAQLRVQHASYCQFRFSSNPVNTCVRVWNKPNVLDHYAKPQKFKLLF